ncbi:MAG: mechanosensitive ion channel [Phycisphaerales bacterium]|jgi:small conductance mechanosensitive channel|nr:mechanosensitive ion channel [Phycisphaerales bacterium]
MSVIQSLMLALTQATPDTKPTEEAGAAASSGDLDKAKESLSSVTNVKSMSDLQDKGAALWEIVQTYSVEYLPKILFAVIWLLIGLFIIKIIIGGVSRGFKLRDIEDSVRLFVMSVLRIGLRILLLIMVLGMLGVPTASLGFIIGAASLAVGFALKDTLQNFAGGVIILLLKPYKIGDFIEAKGFSGSVKEIQIFNTIMTTGDNRRVVIPNGQLSTSSLINYSIEKTRRVEITIGIGYDDDIEQARGVIKKLIDEDARSLHDPEPVIKVGNLGDSSVDMLIRVWVEKADFWAYRVDFLEKAKIAFDAQNISIPYPQSEVTMRSESA